MGDGSFTLYWHEAWIPVRSRGQILCFWSSAAHPKQSEEIDLLQRDAALYSLCRIVSSRQYEKHFALPGHNCPCRSWSCWCGCLFHVLFISFPAQCFSIWNRRHCFQWNGMPPSVSTVLWCGRTWTQARELQYLGVLAAWCHRENNDWPCHTGSQLRATWWTFPATSNSTPVPWCWATRPSTSATRKSIPKFRAPSKPLLLFNAPNGESGVDDLGRAPFHIQ